MMEEGVAVHVPLIIVFKPLASVTEGITYTYWKLDKFKDIPIIWSDPPESMTQGRDVVRHALASPLPIRTRPIVEGDGCWEIWNWIKAAY